MQRMLSLGYLHGLQKARSPHRGAVQSAPHRTERAVLRGGGLKRWYGTPIAITGVDMPHTEPELDEFGALKRRRT